MIATRYNRGSGYAHRLPQWERSWIETRFIPERKSCGNCSRVSWINEEDIVCAARDLAKSQGDGKMSSLKFEREYNLHNIGLNLAQAISKNIGPI
jgi:hypothetical protein